MKNKKFIYLSLIFFSVIFAQCQNITKKDYSKVKVSSELDTVSYYLGALWGKQAVANKVTELNYDALIKGFEQAFNNDSTIPPDFAVSMYLNQYVSKKYEATLRDENKEYIENNEQFLADNSKKEGVITLSSGLQYKIITEGTGPRPASSDQVKVHYTGTMIDGTKFDSSVDRGEPAVFAVSGLIKGFTEALMLMPVGSKWTLYIPETLGYGGRPQGAIKPFSTLIFDVELLEIVQNQDQPQE
ncbi:MAG: FKBP-type peptidyl-prolyl cis-trans isomerase [Bacteroidales bacterium]|nr:FKBP-type peptidyl-prolyl cis-trans isomerase [Bacteroidales bacterium]